MTFADGAPIDAAKLNALETLLTDIKANMPKIGSGTGTVAPQIYGGSTGSITLSTGTKMLFTIDYSAAQLAAVPASIVLTPVFPDMSAMVNVHVIPGSITATTASCEAVLVPVGSAVIAASQAVTFNYILICQ